MVKRRSPRILQENQYAIFSDEAKYMQLSTDLRFIHTGRSASRCGGARGATPHIDANRILWV